MKTMSYPNNHKHKFFQKDHEKMMCSECEFELDGEYYVQYVIPLEQENKELRTRNEELTAMWRNAEDDNIRQSKVIVELRIRLSTLLKASEGMEKALEDCVKFIRPIDSWSGRTTLEIATEALADFRAVKEHNEIKGGGSEV